jgi:hypothetical protein
MCPVTYAGSASAMSRSGVTGVKGLRVTGWVVYGLSLLDAAVAIGFAASDAYIPDGVAAALGVLGMSGLLAFSIDAFVARGQALERGRPTASSPADAPGLSFAPLVAPIRMSDGSTASLFGLAGRF